MTTTDRTVVRLRSPGDLLALLPYHLGYVPERSLVVVTLHGSTLFFVGRVDLPPADVSGRDAAHAVLAPMARHGFDRAFVVTVEDALVREPEEAGPGPAAPRSWTDLAREVCAGLRAHGAEVEERITVRDGFWWHPDGRPSERLPQRLPADADVPAVAEYVGRGRVPLRHRDDLTGLVRGGREASAASAASAATSAVAVAVAVDDLVLRFAECGAERRFLRRAAVAAWARLVAQDLERAPLPRGAGSTGAGTDAGTALGTGAGAGAGAGAGTGAGTEAGVVAGGPDLPLLVASLHDVTLRDLVLGWLCPESTFTFDPSDGDPELLALAGRLRTGTGSVPEGTAPDVSTDVSKDVSDPVDASDGSDVSDAPDPGHLVAVLTGLCRACPPGRGAPLLAVLGHVAWWHGDGALARVAVEAALEQDPRYSLAVLLTQLLDLAVAPRHVA